jgi:hypothetical protein
MEQKQKRRAARSPFPENRLRTRRPSQVDITRILIQLKAQRDHLNIAIAALEDIAPRAEKSSLRTARNQIPTESPRPFLRYHAARGKADPIPSCPPTRCFQAV